MRVRRLRSAMVPRCSARDDGRLVVELAVLFPTLTAKNAVRMGHPGWWCGLPKYRSGRESGATLLAQSAAGRRLARARRAPLRWSPHEIFRLGKEDIRHVGLRVAVIERKQLDWICTMIRWPGWNTWFAVGRRSGTAAPRRPGIGDGCSKLSRYRPGRYPCDGQFIAAHLRLLGILGERRRSA